MAQQATSLTTEDGGEVVDADINHTGAEAIAVQPVQVQTSQGTEVIVFGIKVAGAEVIGRFSLGVFCTAQCF